MNILYLFDVLIISLYVALIIFISPFLVQFLKLFTNDWVLQLLAIPFITLLSSASIALYGYGGFSNSFFFQLVSILSLVLMILLSLLLVTKFVWKEHYENIVLKLTTYRNSIQSKFRSTPQ